MTTLLSGYVVLPIGCLVTMPFPSRFEAEDSELDELTESVRSYGVLEPIVVRPKTDGIFEVVMGERRVKATKKAGLREIPAIIKELSDEEAVVLQFTENIHRKDLSDLEKQKMLVFLSTLTKWSPKEIAEKLKRSYTWVMLHLPDKFKNEEKAKAGQKGGEARALAIQEAATIIVAPEDLAASEQKAMMHRTQCQNPSCLRLVPEVEIRYRNDKPYCLKCAPFIKEIMVEKRETEKKTIPSQLDSYEHKKAHLADGDPEVDRVLFARLSDNQELRDAGWNVEYHQKHVTAYVEDDVSLSNNCLGVKIAVFFDGKCADKDKKNRENAQRVNEGLEVLALPYKDPSNKEFDRLLCEVLEKVRVLGDEGKKWKGP